MLGHEYVARDGGTRADAMDPLGRGGLSGLEHYAGRRGRVVVVPFACHMKTIQKTNYGMKGLIP